MGRLIYSTIASLDGYVEDAQGRFDWAKPDDEVFGFLNDLERSFGTSLCGRRMYEVMVYWETAPTDESVASLERDFTQMWRAQEKVVYSSTLQSASSTRTRIERRLDPETVRGLKRSTPKDISIAGATLASQAISAGLVDEFHLSVAPVIVGGGKPWLPKGVYVNLELIDSHRFASGFVFLKYRPAEGKTGTSQ
jgi:dihydrofolate reductase